MTLRQHLTEMMTTRPAVYRALVDELAARLGGTALEHALKPGDTLPPFVLPDARGQLVFSGDLLARGPLVVIFFRGDWCPFCKATLTALNQSIAAIRAEGAELVALTLDTGDHAVSDWRGLGLDFPVLSDADGGTALQFGAIYRVPDPLRAFFEAHGVDLAMRHGDPAWCLPIPATFVMDRRGIVRHVHASGDIADRMEPEEILAKLREIAAEDG